MTATSIYTDKRNQRMPYAVTIREGATGCLITIHRFALEADARAFYEEHRA